MLIEVFLLNLIYSIMMIVFGRVMWKHHTKKPNHFVGYRTKRSMLSEEAWTFAQEDCGKRWWKVGWVMLVITVLIQIPFYTCSEEQLSKLTLAISILETAVLLFTTFLTEIKLKNYFDDEGFRIM